MISIWKAAVEEFDQRRNFVLATILDVHGPSPRHVGTRFLVRGDGSIVGTIGGGMFEADVQKFAASALETGLSRRDLFSFTGADASANEMICGGETDVLMEFVNSGDKAREAIFQRLLEVSRERISGSLFTALPVAVGGRTAEPIRQLLVDQSGTRLGGIPCEEEVLRSMPEKRLLKPAQFLEVPGCEYPVFLESIRSRGEALIFGAGHVGACVAHVAAYVGFKVTLIDDRSDYADSRRVPDADRVVVLDSFDRAFAAIPVDEDSYAIIVTRGHAHDKTVLVQALRTTAGYIGMIGSKRKTGLVLQSLLQEGFTQEDIDRVYTPIGLDIGGETPEEIALSIVGEMVSVRNRKNGLPRPCMG